MSQPLSWSSTQPISVCLQNLGHPSSHLPVTCPGGKEVRAGPFCPCQSRDSPNPGILPSLLPTLLGQFLLLRMPLALLSHQGHSFQHAKPTSRLNSCSALETHYISSSPYQALSLSWTSNLIICVPALVVPQVCVILWVLIFQHLTLDTGRHQVFLGPISGLCTHLLISGNEVWHQGVLPSCWELCSLFLCFHCALLPQVHWFSIL